MTRLLLAIDVSVVTHGANKVPNMTAKLETGVLKTMWETTHVSSTPLREWGAENNVVMMCTF